MGFRLAGAYANNRDVAVRTLGNRLIYRRDEQGFGRERWNGSVELTRRKSIYEYQYLAAGYNFNRISDSTLFRNSNYFGENRQSQRFLEMRYTWVSDHRNLRNFATKGYYLTGFAGQVGVLPNDHIRLTMIRLSGARYHQLAKRWFWASKADVEYSTPSKQPYYGSRALGYDSRYPRGYERYVIEGHFNTYARNTLRFKTFSRVLHLKWIPIRQFQFMPFDIYLTGYGDAGYVDNPKVFAGNERLTNELLVGYGFGINLVTFYDVVFRTEFSMTRQGDRGLFFSFLTDI